MNIGLIPLCRLSARRNSFWEKAMWNMFGLGTDWCISISNIIIKHGNNNQILHWGMLPTHFLKFKG